MRHFGSERTNLVLTIIAQNVYNNSTVDIYELSPGNYTLIFCGYEWSGISAKDVNDILESFED